jgi:hypothetical protein
MLASPLPAGKLAIGTARNNAALWPEDQPAAISIDGRQAFTYGALFERLQLLQLRVDIPFRVLTHQLQQQGICLVRPAITA